MAETTIRPRVVVIDDEWRIRDVFCEFLDLLGYQAEAATNATHGVELLRANRYDVILTDLVMPDLSGWEVARLARELQPGVPIVIATGSLLPDDIARFRQEGITLLPKPVRFDDFRNAVQAARASAMAGGRHPNNGLASGAQPR